MKRIMLLLFTAFTFSLLLPAQEDTTQITEWEDRIEESGNNSNHESRKRSEIFDDFNLSNMWGQTTGILIIVFSFPLIIVFMSFYFQYRTRRERYRLAEKALEAGQPIPKEFIKSGDDGGQNTLNKGIKNIFTGIGLFIFLWAITNNFAIGAIGLLIMFTGFGQVVIYYIGKNKEDK